MQIPGWCEYSKHCLLLKLFSEIDSALYAITALLIWSGAWLTESPFSANFEGFACVLGSTVRGGIEVQSSQCQKIMAMLNGEEEPPAVKFDFSGDP